MTVITYGKFKRPFCVQRYVVFGHFVEYVRGCAFKYGFVFIGKPAQKHKASSFGIGGNGDLIARFCLDLCNGASSVRNKRNRIGIYRRYYRSFITAYITNRIGIVIVNVRRLI